MFKVDSFLTKGSSHDICEDYIIHGETPFPYVILSDGCSSSKNTDVGARILVYAAKSILESYENHLDRIEYHDFGSRVIIRAQTVAESMGLDMGCLDATLMVLYIHKGFFYSLCYGDGTLIIKTKDDKLQFENYSFSKNMPYYLSYKINSEKDNRYKQHSKEVGNIEEIEVKNPFGESKFEVSMDNDISTMQSLMNINSIFITSDGVESFTQKVNGQQIPYQEVIKECTDICNTNGVFMKRTMGSNRGVVKSYAKNNINHFDDVSIGAIIYEEDK